MSRPTMLIRRDRDEVLTRHSPRAAIPPAASTRPPGARLYRDAQRLPCFDVEARGDCTVFWLLRAAATRAGLPTGGPLGLHHPA